MTWFCDPSCSCWPLVSMWLVGGVHWSLSLHRFLAKMLLDSSNCWISWHCLFSCVAVVSLNVYVEMIHCWFWDFFIKTSVRPALSLDSFLLKPASFEVFYQGGIQCSFYVFRINACAVPDLSICIFEGNGKLESTKKSTVYTIHCVVLVGLNICKLKCFLQRKRNYFKVFPCWATLP